MITIEFPFQDTEEGSEQFITIVRLCEFIQKHYRGEMTTERFSKLLQQGSKIHGYQLKEKDSLTISSDFLSQINSN